MLKLCLTLITSLVAIASAVQIQPRIVNGIPSKSGQFPYYVFVFGNTTADVEYCGGSLISDRWIITAAHCFFLLEQGNVSVDLGMDKNGIPILILPVDSKNIHIHPNFKKDVIHNDIALIELSTPIKLTSHIQPIKLPNDCGKNLLFEKVTAIGRGKSSSLPCDFLLRHANLRITSNVVCRKTFTSLFENSDSVICANSVHGRSVSHGDSGGPLVRNSDNTLIGITSAGKILSSGKISSPYIPQAFTKIHSYFDWISNKTGMDLPKC